MVSRRVVAVLAVLVATLVAAPLAHAATLSVDDDGLDCGNAPYHAIQAAVDAAAPGDTIAICPGTYAEGTGAIGTNALTIAKSLTLKGAGADLVTIRPVNAGGQIAEGSPALRNGIGDIVVARGTPAAPVTVNLSGLTVDGAGVASEIGVLFLDAQGSIVRSRVTNVVTSEADGASSQIGGYRSALPGIGVAQLTAAGLGSSFAPRPLLIDHTRIDRYNRIGVLVDGSDGDTPPLTATGVVNTLQMLASQVIGRTLCVNYRANGNCASVNLLTSGPLFGQDGVRVAGGATATIRTSLISQNLVNGTGAPTRNSATNNANLVQGAGVRLIGAGASTIAKTNIVDNAYGVLNLLLAGSGANTATPVSAEGNWWGLRYNFNWSVGTPNPGPAISPTTNPPVPENPVNGTAVADGTGTSSTAVDFFPFRNGPQANPTSGEVPLLGAPTPAADLAPSVALSAAPEAGYYPGGYVLLRATPSDDFGIRSVTFYDGASVAATMSAPPYASTIAVPADLGCGPRSFAVVVEDSSGQTSSASTSLAGRCTPDAAPDAGAPSGGGTEASAPSTAGAPSVAIVAPPARLSGRGGTISIDPNADYGVARVDVYLGTRLVCTVASPPYTCDVKPTADDVGGQTLRVVVTDNLGATAESSSPITVDRFAPSALALSVESKRLDDGLARKTISGSLTLPGGLSAAKACAGGTIALRIARGGSTFDDVEVPLARDCGFTRSFTAKRRGASFTVRASFGGNAVLSPISNSRRFS